MRPEVPSEERTQSLPLTPYSPADGTRSQPLAERHFTHQGERPPHLGEVDLDRVESALRTLLFTDGTVTRTLEAQTLSPASVAVISQDGASTGEEIARYLEVPPMAPALRRRVRIAIGKPSLPAIWAESHILPNRLPEDFFNVLSGASDGIGGSLQQVRLESWREMLWFGFERPPAWTGVNTADERSAITRLYRVIARERPALLISETFNVKEVEGKYRLAPADGYTEPNSSSIS